MNLSSGGPSLGISQASTVDSTARAVDLRAKAQPSDLLRSLTTSPDSVADLLELLTPNDVDRLTAILEPIPCKEMTVLLEGWKNAALQAVEAWNTVGAVASLSQLAAADPHAYATISAEEAFAVIRPEVDQLTKQLIFVARTDADTALR